MPSKELKDLTPAAQQHLMMAGRMVGNLMIGLPTAEAAIRKLNPPLDTHRQQLAMAAVIAAAEVLITELQSLAKEVGLTLVPIEQMPEYQEAERALDSFIQLMEGAERN